MDAKTYAEAQVACAEAVAREPGPKSQQALMRARFLSGDLDGALSAARPVLEGPLAGSAWRIVGRIHERRGEAAQARAAFQSALDRHTSEGVPREAAYDAHALAGSHWRAGEYRLALDALLRTRTEAERGGDERMIGYALLGVGTLLNQVGDAEGAERAFARAAKHLGALSPAERANLAIERGIVALESDHPEVAIGHFEEALTHARTAESIRYERVALENLARAELAAGRLEGAAAHAAGAAALLDRDPDEHDTVFVRYLEGALAQRQGRYADARRALARAAEHRPVPEMVWRIALEEGRAAEGAGQVADAEQAYRRSIDAIEKMRRAIGVEELKRAFLAAKREPYEALFRLQADAGRTDDAVTTLERALARTFLDAVVLPAAGTTPAGAPTGSAEPDSAWNAAASRADELKAVLSSVTASGVAEPLSPAEIRATLGDRTLLAYYTTGSRAWIVAWRAGGVSLHALAASADDIARLADAVVADIDAPGPAAALADALGLSKHLPPDAGAPVYFAPTGALVRVPIGLLRPTPAGPLALSHPVVNAPSATAVAVVLRRTSPALGPPAVLGDARGDLPAAAAEARHVAGRLSVPAALGPAASAAALRRIGHPRILHIATHAGSGPSGPWLALADGPLGIGDLLSLHLDAELVVLASCASGAADAAAGDLWGSLAAAFLAGGARNVLATLRSVDDAAARRFVETFYAEGGDRQPVVALHATVRRLAAAGPPSTWAHFVLLGAGDPAPR
jgi:tetratricopeptide (TPR) repeat protein